MKRFLGEFFKGDLGRLGLALLVASSLGAVVALAFAMYHAGELYDYTDTVDGVRLPEVDAIAVLAGGRGRIAGAGDIWYRYWELSQYPLRAAGRAPLPTKPPILYLAGMGEKSSFATVQTLVRRGVWDVLVPELVIVENRSRNTWENASFLADETVVRHWDRLLLITSPYHMKRAKLLLERELRTRKLQNVVVETYTILTEPFDAQEWRESSHGVRVTLEEYLKLLYLRWTLDG